MSIFFCSTVYVAPHVDLIKREDEDEAEMDKKKKKKEDINGYKLRWIKKKIE